MQATREIMWAIPSEYKTAMYSLFAISLFFMVRGLYKKMIFVTGEKNPLSIKNVFPDKFNWQSFFKTIFFAGKVNRKKYIAIVHGLIFYGFIILWIATDLVAIHYDTPFKVFQGTVYIVISFLADFAGIAILIGISLAYWRRYIQKPSYLSASKPNQEKFMYIMLIALVVLGFVIEGIRIVANDMPIGEKTWAPIGWLIASLMTDIDKNTLLYSYRYLWFIHMVNTMVFIASLGYSKFSHMFILPFSSLVTPKYRGAILQPMNFEDENAESFGLGKISELSAKNKLDLIACVECGRCTEVCPANLASKPLDPKLIITKLRDISVDSKNDVNFWDDKKIYNDNELDACTTCGACMEECPANIEHIDIIMGAKRYKALTLGSIPPNASTAINNIKNNGNPWGISQEDRFNWANELDIPLINTEEYVDYLYYIGCAGAYDSSNQKVVKDTIKLLKKANVKFAVIGKSEKCNGDPIRRFGDEYTFSEIAIENIEQFNKYKFKTIITHCPHCLHTIGKEYSLFDNGKFNVIHHTEILSELIKENKLKPTKEINQELTYHDPCYLGRHHGEYNAPRFILNSIPGIKIKEMKRNKDTSLCCGMGGGNMWYELSEGEHLSKKRLEDISETKATKLASACSYCLINFNSSKNQVKETESLEIEDISSILAKSID